VARQSVFVHPVEGIMKVTGLKERIGFLYSGSESSLRGQLIAFHRGLKEANYVDGQNIKIEYLSADDDYTRLPDLAAKLVGYPVEVIVAAGGQISAVAAKKANEDAKRAIPIVFTTVANPIALGLVASLNRPGGNLTGTAGLTSELDPIRLELLHQVMRSQKQKSKQQGPFGALCNSNRPRLRDQSANLKDAADAIGRELHFLNADPGRPLELAFTSFVKQTKAKGEGGALVVTADPFFNGKRAELVALAAKYKIPAIYQWREFAMAGGLMSYGPSITDAYYQAGIYVGRILNGERPSELPVQQPTKFELVINLKAAAALGLNIPPEIIGRPDAEVIE
jgi:putative ABC transport system substrate-binding protein